VGAALVTILSEFSLLFPFYLCVRRHVGPVPWISVFAGPLVATLLMGVTIFGLTRLDVNIWPATVSGALLYLAALYLTGALRAEDMALVGRALPLGPLRRLLPVSG
jgi:hypothetical protein